MTSIDGSYFFTGFADVGDTEAFHLAELDYHVYEGGAEGAFRLGTHGDYTQVYPPFPVLHMTMDDTIYLGYPDRRTATDAEGNTGVPSAILLEVEGLFTDGFESGDTGAWQ